MNLWRGILPSPDVLNTIRCRGEDVTATLNDYVNIWNLVEGKGFRGWYAPETSYYINLLENERTIMKADFGPMVKSAYQLAFDPVRNTTSLDKEETILFYYAGHGISKDNIENDLTDDERSRPPVPEMPYLREDYFAAADKLLPRGNLKGGELYLHHRGFCDLRGLLRPFIAALETPSSNVQTDGEQVKRNKHLVIVVDSCYSGVFADDLRKMKDAEILERWLERGCSITVQASCKPDETTFGGYFTPCFVRLNEDPQILEQLRGLWESKCPEQKRESIEKYGDDLPSPTVYSTKAINSNDIPLILFNEPDFFKFCYITLYGNSISEPRKLSKSETKGFLSQTSFRIIDFKLKTYKKKGCYEGTPMGLFLVEIPNDPAKAVVVHAHYEKNNPNKPTKFKLFEHDCTKTLNQESTGGSELYNACEATTLMETCKAFVKTNVILPPRTEFEDWWKNLTNWNMEGIGFCKLFRKTKRTLWMKNALEKRNELH